MNELKVRNFHGKKVIDSRDVAVMVERDHKDLLRNIRTYSQYLAEGNFALGSFFIENQMERLERFGRVRFEFTPFETKGGMQNHKLYFLNEEQATLLITFLKNTSVVADFKVSLVAAFYATRQELTRRKELRTEGKPIRRSLTDALKDSGEAERMKGHAYAAYTNLAYKLATGKSAGQLRKERGAGRKAVAADFLTSTELERYQKQSYAIAALLDVGLDYPRIRAALAGKENEH